MKTSTILSVVGFTALATAAEVHTTFATHFKPTGTAPAPAGLPTIPPPPGFNGTQGGHGGYGGHGHPHGPRSAADTYSGDLTWYNVGLGACGIDSSGQDLTQNIVALNYEQMGELSNTNPYCGKTITINGNGKTATGTILDKCMGCAYGSIDVSEKLFEEIFGDLGIGRGQVTWSFN